LERPPLGRERRSQERASEWEWGWAGETREMCLFGENFRAGDLDPGKRQAARSESGDGSAFYAFPTNLRLFR